MITFYFIFIVYVPFKSKSFFQGKSDYFSDYSSKMKVNLDGYMIAFGDFNADRATDIFVLNKIKGIQNIDVILMTQEFKSYFRRFTILKDVKNDINGVVVGDFNGDSVLDLIIYRKKSDFYYLEIAYGMLNMSGLNPAITVYPEVICTIPPFHLDYNADMIGDILCQLPNKAIMIIIGQKNGTFLNITTNIDIKFLKELMYSKFLDLNNDHQADILFVGRNKDNNMVLISYVKEKGEFIHSQTYTYNKKVNLIGQGIVADFSLSGKMSMIVPMCGNSNCSNSFLIMCTLDTLSCSDTNTSFYLSGKIMQFVPGSIISKLSLTVPQLNPMSCGDLHLTGFIECLVIISRVNDFSSKNLVLLVHDKSGKFYLREIEGETNLFTNVSQAAIFDLEENGILDIIVAKPNAGSGLIEPLWHQNTNDQYFIKVMVLNGLCSNPGNCPSHKLPFGIPLPGVSVSYETEAADGGRQVSATSICSDSAYTSLQLPYALFGLGAFANYVEKLTITLPYNAIQRKHSLSFIVPKTQIVIIPYPLDDPSEWTNKLFLDPFGNNNALYVAVALLSSFLAVSIVVFLLMYQERRNNRQEREKFHFDAM